MLREDLGGDAARITYFRDGETETLLTRGDAPADDGTAAYTACLRQRMDGKVLAVPGAAGSPAYLGVTVFWPNGDMFGVVEAIRDVTTPWSGRDEKLIGHVRDCIQDQLALHLAHSQSAALKDSEERFRLFVENSAG